MSRIPAEVQIHKQLKKIFQAREKSIETSHGIDWGTAEALAFGTLLMEGNHVRLSGQDVQRGTFSHRHAVVKDQKTGASYTPLNNLAEHMSADVALAGKGVNKSADTQAEFVARNSILSEYGVLGFEMGYSLENPNTLVLWEAQFGDFVNGAQIMIDQFISAGEDKWLRQSGLTLLLPHGYMGQGAEHSSCRIERFLQQVDEDPDVVPDMTGTWVCLFCASCVPLSVFLCPTCGLCPHGIFFDFASHPPFPSSSPLLLPPPHCTHQRKTAW